MRLDTQFKLLINEIFALSLTFFLPHYPFKYTMQLDLTLDGATLIAQATFIFYLHEESFLY